MEKKKTKKSVLFTQFALVIVFAFCAIGSGTSNLSTKEAYDAGYKIGEGVGTLIYNYAEPQEKPRPVELQINSVWNYDIDKSIEK